MTLCALNLTIIAFGLLAEPGEKCFAADKSDGVGREGSIEMAYLSRCDGEGNRQPKFMHGGCPV